ncbi:MAG: Do family serine endopeptidase [Spirochaetes bacterium]|nr:Do family serine endopeptidase [Spirochaetota bacterium]
MKLKIKLIPFLRYLLLFIILTLSITTSLFIINSCDKKDSRISSTKESILAQDKNNENQNNPNNLPVETGNDLAISLALQERLRKIVKDSLPAVVHITSIVEQQIPSYPFPFPFFPDYPEGKRDVEVYGSGFIISKDGYILTNNHVISDAKEVKVILMDGSEYKGEVLGRDPSIDVAMLKINPGKKVLPILKFGDSDKIEVGDIIIAIGNPFGLDGTVTQGIISAKGRYNIGINNLENFIQIDAAINPGNSGGPLINLNGEVIGINDAILSNTQQFAGIGLAIPINMVKPIIENLIKNKPIERGYLGISLQPMTNDKLKYYDVKDLSGAIVVYVDKNSPAEKAGIKPGDLIIELNGQKIKDMADLRNKVMMMPAGKEVILKIIRIENDKKQEMNIKVILGKRPSEITQGVLESNWLGVQISSLNDQIKQKYNIYGIDKGVVVIQVKRDSLADRAGIIEGDVIMQINDFEIKNVDDFYSTLEKVKDNKKFRFIIYRRGAMILITITK